MSVNARGLRDITKRKSFFLFCKGKNVNFIFLQETHSKVEDITFWSKQWGDEMYFSHGTSRSAGVAILLKNFKGQIISHVADVNGHWLILIVTIDDFKLILVNIYGYNGITENKNLLEQIGLRLDNIKSTYSTENVIIGGDLNLVHDEFLDKCPTRFSSSHPNSTFTNFCNDHGLTDAWRHLNPGILKFSWFNSNYKSRIDNWLIANNLLNYNLSSDISAAPLTDHSVILLYVKPNNRRTCSNKYWKFNSSLIKSDDYCQKIKSLITEIINSEELTTPVKKWEFLKYKIRQFTILFSKKSKKDFEKKELNIIKQLNVYCNKLNPTEDDKQKILNLQPELDEMYIQRAQGAFIRSRAKWIEEGEKNSAYFCGLEKRRQKKNNINTLLVNDIEITEPKSISLEILKFYKQLYSSKFSEEDCHTFLKDIEEYIPKVGDNFKQTCDNQITMAELDGVIGRLSLNKAPGSDGLTGDFYRHFWEDIKKLLHQAFVEIFETCILPPTMRHGLIISIPKPGKDPRLIENRRPITLRNSDYKLLTYIFSTRLQTEISHLIAETQSGFLKGRSIHNNIRLVMDIIEYRNQIENDGFLLFLDFYKAFDSVEHPFIFQVLEHLGFGIKFRNLVGGLYQNINSCVVLPHGTTPSFNVSVGIPQGCPISPYLFILVTEMLAIYIKNCNEIKHLHVLGTDIVISQLADDTTIFVQDRHQIPITIDKIKNFSKASGLTLNLNKCELFAIHDTTLKDICNIPIKSEIKYLGVYLTKDQKQSQYLNVEQKIKTSKAILNSWLQRDLSILGRIYLTKMECLSRCIYPAYSSAIPNKLIKSINQINLNFIWRNKPHYMKKSDMIKEIKDGGLKVIDFDCLNGTLKINWLKFWIKHSNSFWYCIPNALFKKIGGLNCLLTTDFNVNKLPVSLSEFHKQILLYWKMLYVHNFSPHTTMIWNNRYILYRNKSLFYQDWYERNIWSIVDLMDANGNLLDYEQFCTKHKFNPSKSDFTKLQKALPHGFVFLTKNILAHQPIMPQLAPLSLQGISVLDKKCNNKFIRNCLSGTLFPNKQNKNDILHKFDKKSIDKLRTMYLTFPIPPKTKETHFKIMNNIYPSKELLRLRFNIGDNMCTFCENEIETTDHIFFSCDAIQTFWNNLHKFIKRKIVSFPSSISKDNVTFGMILKNKNDELCCNVILCLANFFIHKNRILKSSPKFCVFMNEFKMYLKSLKLITTIKAQNLYDLLKNFPY